HWPKLFTDDIHAIYEGAPRPSADDPRDIEIRGCDKLVEGVRTLMKGAQSIHQGFMPELTIISDDYAKGVWSMFDYVMLPTCHFKGWGHYFEEYQKNDGVWQIKKIHLTRLHTEETWL
ncbi:nuclear transport factor 2 family protein, partial [Pseudomonadota bacterium]|nr:nuclear transport factor 2 family protein [Pseudomonadota bacterium]